MPQLRWFAGAWESGKIAETSGNGLSRQMSLSDRNVELRRLISAFEVEASKFHDLQFHAFFVTQEGPNSDRVFVQPNHAIMLWQYYGRLGDPDDLCEDLKDSNLQWGVRGAALTMYGVIEGDSCNLFVRMANRAGSWFTDEQASQIRQRVSLEILEHEFSKQLPGKPVAVTNDNPLAVWLNYLLYHLSLTFPGRERAHKIQPDPYSLSLLALERLAVDNSIEKIDRSSRKLSDIRFKVAMSFPGEVRAYVANVVEALRVPLGPDSIFYDHDYQAQLARPNLDTLLQDIYRDRSELVVVFLCSDYARKEWCGLEWRAIRDLIKAKLDDRIMFVRFDDAKIDGVLSIDGYIDADSQSPADVAGHIRTRIAELH
jgi:hypothetical protein